MRCQDIQDELIDVTSADFVSKDPRVRAHLATCAGCRASLERAFGAWTMLAAAADDEPDSDAMRTRFAAVIERHERRRAWPMPAWQLAFGLTAVLVALVA